MALTWQSHGNHTAITQQSHSNHDSVGELVRHEVTHHCFDDPSGEAILTWTGTQRKLPWGTMLLIGGGYALGDGITSSGLAKLFAEQLQTIAESVGELALVYVITLFCSVPPPRLPYMAAST